MSEKSFEFRIGQDVFIIGLDNLIGKIIVRSDYCSHHQYLVNWWLNGQRHEEWLIDFELSA